MSRHTAQNSTTDYDGLQFKVTRLNDPATGETMRLMVRARLPQTTTEEEAHAIKDRLITDIHAAQQKIGGDIPLDAQVHLLVERSKSKDCFVITRAESHPPSDPEGAKRSATLMTMLCERKNPPAPEEFEHRLKNHTDRAGWTGRN